MVFITGDVHYPIDSRKLFKLAEKGIAGKDDTIIVCGDMGIVWHDIEHTRRNIMEVAALPFTTCFVDGNHEHHTLLSTMPCRKHYGARCHELASNVFHLMRGRVYCIENMKFFAMGGAQSHDKEVRHINIDWFPDEVPSILDFRHASDALRLYKNTVDFVVTHEAPYEVAKLLYAKGAYEKYGLQDYFSQLQSDITYKHWFCGHHHIDQDFGNTHILYNRVLQLTESGYTSIIL